MANSAYTQRNDQFSKAVQANVRTSSFMMNNSVKTTFNCGDLVPIDLIEVLPGDSFDLNLAFVTRLATPIFPTMDDIKLEFFAYFVPHRIVWDEWINLMGEDTTGPWTPTNPPNLVPIMSGDDSNQVSKRQGDYYGIPVNANIGFNATNKIDISALPFRGYTLIWNEWYRDQNFQAPLIVSKDSGVDDSQEYGMNKFLFKVNKPFDYFTSCLPAPQKENPLLFPSN